MTRRGMGGWARFAAIAIVFLAAIGLMHGISSGIFFDWATKPTDASWPWWYYVLALPVMGLLALFADAIGEGVGRILGWVFGPVFRPVAEAWARLPKWLQACVAIAFPVAFIAGAFWLGNQGGGSYDPTSLAPR